MRASKPSPRRGRSTVIIIALLTIVPLLLAWYYASHPELITRRSNYGQLIVPPHPLDTSEFAVTATSPAPLEDSKGRWVLLQIAPEGCQTACAETLYKTHQARLMLNKEISRVRRLLVLPGSQSGWIPTAEQQEDQSLIIVMTSSTHLQNLIEAAGGQLPDDALILMDPIGNLILHYGSGFDPYGLVKDLRHLLKVSQIG